MPDQLALAAAALALCAATAGASDGGKAYPDHARLEKEVAQFERADREEPPPKGAVVCIGGSTIRGWRPRIREDLAPVTVVPRGLGGSNMNDAIHYADRIVIPYAPRAVVLYEGDNDIAAGIPPERVVSTFRAFVARVIKAIPVRTPWSRRG